MCSDLHGEGLRAGPSQGDCTGVSLKLEMASAERLQPVKAVTQSQNTEYKVRCDDKCS